MKRLSYFQTNWTPEEAHTMLILLDGLRDMIWNAYGNEIIEYCQQQDQETDSLIVLDDDKIPF